MREFENLNLSDDTITFFNSNELRNITARLRPFKSAGKDGIINILLKNLPTSALEFLLHNFNKCLRKSYWPKSFSTARVIAIPKAGKSRTSANDFRPISLLNSTGKIFEKLLHQRITEFGNQNNTFNPNQFGFRQRHSCTHQILRLTNWIQANKAAKRSTGMILFDIEKAFDTVWHDALIYKLHHYKFPTYICKMIFAFCKHRSFTVHVGNSSSRDIPFLAGLPQGSALSPLLYCLFVADLKLKQNIQIACYADDTAIFFSANRTKTICDTLQRTLIDIENYYVR